MGTTIQARRKLLFAALGGGSHIDNEYVNRHCRSPSRKYLHKYITLFLIVKGFLINPRFLSISTPIPITTEAKNTTPQIAQP